MPSQCSPIVGYRSGVHELTPRVAANNLSKVHVSHARRFFFAASLASPGIKLLSSYNSAIPPRLNYKPGDSPVVLFLYQMIPGPEGDKMGVVGGRRDGDRSRASHVRVTQLIGQNLKLVGVEVVVVPQYVIMRGTTRTLKTRREHVRAIKYV